MSIKHSIKKKLFTWFFVSVVIFSGTMLILYANVRDIVKISEGIVSKNLEISSEARKMVENLLSMEEYGKKYSILKKEEYRELFMAAAGRYGESLGAILDLEKGGFIVSGPWKPLHREYIRIDLSDEASQASALNVDGWIPESLIDDWIQRISDGLYVNEQEIIRATDALRQQRQAFARNIALGIIVSCVVGVVLAIFLSYSIIRPLRELRSGIRSLSAARSGEPIQVRSTDEFGDLAHAFNEMSSQLMEEERTRSDFISMLSHEIRTPLTSIRESVNMITEEVMGPINAQQRKFLTIAGSEIGRINDLLKHLMQLSRLQSGIVKINPRPFDTCRFMADCIQRIRHVAENKHIDIISDIPDGLPDLMGDPDHLNQVFYNLIGNAIKFSEPETKITVRAAKKGKKRLEFYVIDNGPGIPEDEQTLIFKKYYRGREVRRHMDGVGLGLSISKHIVEVHDGGLWVESEMGAGSTFGVSLPAAPAGAYQ
jgi:signal transduction histidine kinase